ncbi:uncharacterized protein cd86.S isoform X2 [Xenopus laevis]|uniref:Uncharacterized protein cd86.S isoform X2 n=1 Tax=Xenopus laevis TaxID=8355 RepID=A0A8J1MCZ2_XENLA|nr:uncharacterized protein cd86.S isoform X2 [Xenopus laevis]
MTEEGIPLTATTFAYDEEDIDRILSGIKIDDLLKTDTAPAGDTSKELGNLKRKELHIQLHLSTLAEYIKVKRIPRGLRLDIRPNLCNEDPLLQQRWYEICNKCSLDLMLLTVERLSAQLQELQLTICKVREKLTAEKGASHTERVLTELNEPLSKLRETIVTRKRRKFDRDARDYTEGHVYNWREERREFRAQHERYTKQPEQPHWRQGAQRPRPPTNWSSRRRYRNPRPQYTPTSQTSASSSDECLSSSTQSSVPFLGVTTDCQDRNKQRKPQAATTRDQYPKRTGNKTR